MGSAPRPWPKGQPHPSRGTRQPWAGTWGAFGDGRSRLSRAARLIEREQLAVYPVGPPRRRVARLLALAEMVEERIGTDPKCTIRRLTALVAIAERQLGRLEKLVARTGPTSIAELAAKRRAQA